MKTTRLSGMERLEERAYLASDLAPLITVQPLYISELDTALIETSPWHAIQSSQAITTNNAQLPILVCRVLDNEESKSSLDTVQCLEHKSAYSFDSQLNLTHRDHFLDQALTNSITFDAYASGGDELNFVRFEFTQDRSIGKVDPPPAALAPIVSTPTTSMTPQSGIVRSNGGEHNYSPTPSNTWTVRPALLPEITPPPTPGSSLTNAGGFSNFEMNSTSTAEADRPRVAPVRQLTISEGEPTPTQGEQIAPSKQLLVHTPAPPSTTMPLTSLNSERPLASSPVSIDTETLSSSSEQLVLLREPRDLPASALRTVAFTISSASSVRYGWTGLLQLTVPMTTAVIGPSSRPTLAPIPWIQPSGKSWSTPFAPTPSIATANIAPLSAKDISAFAGSPKASIRLPVDYQPPITMPVSTDEDQSAEPSSTPESAIALTDRWYLAAIPILLALPHSLRNHLRNRLRATRVSSSAAQQPN
ncbi:MAG: hypothetical protein IT423_24475 [Pirellulaceae bacterium]|nr:hypothetical protein [Pirellulaceae bacterium]